MLDGKLDGIDVSRTGRMLTFGVGEFVGIGVFLREGLDDGIPEGIVEGETAGWAEGVPEGSMDGATEGFSLIVLDGAAEGLNLVVGASDGTMLGRPEGLMLGCDEGCIEREGPSVGLSPRVGTMEREGTWEGAVVANKNRRSSMQIPLPKLKTVNPATVSAPVPRNATLSPKLIASCRKSLFPTWTPSRL